MNTTQASAAGARTFSVTGSQMKITPLRTTRGSLCPRRAASNAPAVENSGLLLLPRP